jgi:gamma-glutamyltranspeptidase/glutathione hydrolase
VSAPACIAGGHVETVRAAVETLRAGGNAFDAVVAAGFAAAVAEPTLSSLGGGGFLLARSSAGEEILFDFFVDTPGLGADSAVAEPHFVPVVVRFPGSDQTFNVGLGSVAVPGCLAGYLHVHRRLGRLPLSDVVAPAATLAHEGVVLNEQQGYLVGLLEPILTLTAAGAAIYAPGGRLLGDGDRLVNQELAAHLTGLGAGGRGFDDPELAGRIDADMASGGGLLTSADLAAYRVVERAPLSVACSGRRVLTNPPPSFGGELVALGLCLLAERQAPSRWTDATRATNLVEVMIEVDEARSSGRVGDLLRRQASGGTTHISVSDAAGNVASMTTSNGESSGYMAPGTGVMLNNMLGEDDLHPDGFHAAPPGERVASMMSPTIVLHDDAPVLALGSGGSKRIRTALLQVISGALDLGVPLEAAVAGPRLHWDGEQVQVEPGFERDALAAMARRWKVNEWPAPNLYFGGVHAVRPGEAAAGDARRGGAQAVDFSCST